MTVADTMTYDEMVLEVEFVANSGTYSKICGITGVSISRTKAIAESQIPDCDDETKPHSTARDVTSISVSVSGTGVWAIGKDNEMKGWFYTEQKLNARLRNAKVETDGATGDIYAEYGPAILTSMENERRDDKGRVSASIEIQFDGTPSLATVA